MSFAILRHTLFTIHMWIGLILGILLAVLGLSGSLLVYGDAISDLLSPPPRAATAGQALPLTMIADTARDTAAGQGLEIGSMQIFVPQKTGEAVMVRFNAISPMMAQPNGEGGGAQGRRDSRRPPEHGFQMYIDPVSGEVLGMRRFVPPAILTFAHQLHGNFLMGHAWGRSLVGWLGVAMCLLGVTGLVLWWPKRGQWKYAFKIRSSATGLRFHRELHAATGIWIFLIFMAVSFSGVVIAWPRAMALDQPSIGLRLVPTAVSVAGKRLSATEAVIAATAAVPDMKLHSVFLPGRPDRPISVNYLNHDGINATLVVDPNHGKVFLLRNNSRRFLAWMRPVHDGSLGAVWRFLVFLSGFAPALFVVTGLIMWWKKRRRQVPMTAMIDNLAGEGAEA